MIVDKLAIMLKTANPWNTKLDLVVQGLKERREKLEEAAKHGDRQKNHEVVNLAEWGMFSSSTSESLLTFLISAETR